MTLVFLEQEGKESEEGERMNAFSNGHFLEQGRRGRERMGRGEAFCVVFISMMLLVWCVYCQCLWSCCEKLRWRESLLSVSMVLLDHVHTNCMGVVCHPKKPSIILAAHPSLTAPPLHAYYIPTPPIYLCMRISSVLSCE